MTREQLLIVTDQARDTAYQAREYVRSQANQAFRNSVDPLVTVAHTLATLVEDLDARLRYVEEGIPGDDR